MVHNPHQAKGSELSLLRGPMTEKRFEKYFLRVFWCLLAACLPAIYFKKFLEGQGNRYLVNSIGVVMLFAWGTVGSVLEKMDFKVEQIPWLPSPIIGALYLVIQYITIVGLVFYEVPRTKRELIGELVISGLVVLLWFVWWGIRKGWFRRSGE